MKLLLACIALAILGCEETESCTAACDHYFESDFGACRSNDCKMYADAAHEDCMFDCAH